MTRPRFEGPANRAELEDAYGRYRGAVDDFALFCDALERPLPPTLHANTPRIPCEALAGLLRSEGFRPRPIPWQAHGLTLEDGFRPGQHWGLLSGLFQAQEAASMIPVAMLDPQPGHRVLDLCAAPGNKTLQLAAALGHAGSVVANDASHGRMGSLAHALKRHGAVNVTRTVRDGQGLPWSVGRFDRVVVDVPCSCEGTYRKTASAAAPTDPASRERLVNTQVRLLRRGLGLTRPGGLLAYSTCTFAPEENEAIVARVLDAFPEQAELVPARLDGLRTAPGLTDWNGEAFGVRMEACARIWPHHNDTGGFFVALLRRRGDAPDPPRVCPDPEPLPEDPAARAYLDRFAEHFGIDATGDGPLAGLTAYYEGRRYVQVISAGHRPAAPECRMQSGLPAIGVQSRPPKPSTALAMALGAHASRQCVDLSAEEAEGFLKRRPFGLPPERAVGLTPTSFVLARYRGYVIGVGEYRDGQVASLYPKSWVSGARATPRVRPLEAAS